GIQKVKFGSIRECRSARALTELYRNFDSLPAAINRYFHFFAGTLFVEDEIHVKLGRHLLTVNGGNNVAADIESPHAKLSDAIAAANSRLRRGATTRDGLHEQAFLNGKVERFTEAATNGKRIDTQVRLVHAAVGNQIMCDALRRVDRNRKTDTGGSSGWCVDRGIDADHLTAGVDQRSTGIPAIDGGVGLNCFVYKSRLARLYGSAERADDARGQRALKSERIAD